MIVLQSLTRFAGAPFAQGSLFVFYALRPPFAGGSLFLNLCFATVPFGTT